MSVGSPDKQKSNHRPCTPTTPLYPTGPYKQRLPLGITRIDVSTLFESGTEGGDIIALDGLKKSAREMRAPSRYQGQTEPQEIESDGKQKRSDQKPTD